MDFISLQGLPHRGVTEHRVDQPLLELGFGAVVELLSDPGELAIPVFLGQFGG
jgi:hypothetical protein